MKRRSLVALSLVAGLTTMPRTARADHRGGAESVAFLIIGILVVDAAFVTYDTIVVAQNDRPARGACIAEAIVGVPQVLLYTALVPR